MSKLSELTAADVIDAALEQIRPAEGYTDGNYFKSTSGAHRSKPGPDVGATCAIGGVEQAIWRLTRQVVTDDRGAAAYPANPEYGDLPRRITSRLYFEAMEFLNKAAVRTRKVGKPEPGECPIEALTFYVGHDHVVKVFERALADARA